jgi:hypothetical protein
MTKAVISPRVNRPISWALKKTFSTQKTCLDDSGIQNKSKNNLITKLLIKSKNNLILGLFCIFFINIGTRISLRIFRLKSRVLKLTIM